MIVIGLGTGRSGTTSLAKVLGAQRDAFCFHEMNPACVRFSGTPRPILNTIDEFQAIVDGGDPSRLTVDLSFLPSASAYDQICKMDRVRMIGDVAFYYLRYVEEISTRNRRVRFLCMRRDIDATVTSWLEKTSIRRWRSKYVADRLASWITRTPFHEARNYWMEHDGSLWKTDQIWDKCFPKFDATSRAEAIAKYCEFYYTEADRLASILPDRFRFVDTLKLNDLEYQSEILDFLDIPRSEQNIVYSHVHRSESKLRLAGAQPVQ